MRFPPSPVGQRLRPPAPPARLQASARAIAQAVQVRIAREPHLSPPLPLTPALSTVILSGFFLSIQSLTASSDPRVVKSSFFPWPSPTHSDHPPPPSPSLSVLDPRWLVRMATVEESLVMLHVHCLSLRRPSNLGVSCFSSSSFPSPLPLVRARQRASTVRAAALSQLRAPPATTRASMRPPANPASRATRARLPARAPAARASTRRPAPCRAFSVPPAMPVPRLRCHPRGLLAHTSSPRCCGGPTDAARFQRRRHSKRVSRVTVTQQRKARKETDDHWLC